MKTQDQLKNETKDSFSFILVFCPNWPRSLKEMTTAKAFDNLISGVQALSERTEKDVAKEWFDLCLEQITRSQKAYESGDATAGKRFIQEAEIYYDNALQKKPIEPRFFSGEKGSVFDTENGFPE